MCFIISHEHTHILCEKVGKSQYKQTEYVRYGKYKEMKLQTLQEFGNSKQLVRRYNIEEVDKLKYFEVTITKN